MADIGRFRDLRAHLIRQKRACDIAPASAACRALEEVITQRQPVTLAGVIAKLRLAQEISPSGPIYAVQQATLAQALAWIDPAPARSRRRKKGARA